MIEEESSRVKEKLTLRKKYDIPLDNLSYEYIENCNDVKTLEKIIKILRSGEEGEYPDLIQFAENRLKVVCPTNRLLIKPEPVRTPSSLNADDRNKITNEMEFWSDEMKKKEDMLKGAGELKSPSFPPIRNYVDSFNVKKTSSTKKKCSIKSLDYDAWDKYDPDKEILSSELEEEREREEYARNAEEKHVKNLLESNVMELDNYSETEKQIFAEQEKERGNECFKAGQYEQASQFYTKSIAISANVAAYNNRAIANLKLKKYGEVIMDCNEVLQVEPENVKALYRRGNAHQCKGQLNEAMKDFIRVLEVDPSNNLAKSHVSELKKKLEETAEGKPKKARMVVEDMKSFEEELKSIQIFDKKVQSSSGSKPIPSWKNSFSNDPMSFGDNKLNEWGYPRVMCNCTSMPCALQNKCKPHTKRVATETGKSSIQIANKYSNQGNKSQAIDEGIEKQPAQIDEKESDIRMLGSSSGDNSNSLKAPKDMPILNDEDAITINRGIGDTLSNNRITALNPSYSSENSEAKPMEISENNGDNEEMELESPLSPYDFLRSWNQISEDEGFIKHASLLKKISPSNLSKVIGNELDGYMLSTLLNCLNLHFNNEEELLMDYLTSISHLSRFKAMQSCLSPQENEVVQGLFHKLELCGKSQIKDLKMAYGLL